MKLPATWALNILNRLVNYLRQKQTFHHWSLDSPLIDTKKNWRTNHCRYQQGFAKMELTNKAKFQFFNLTLVQRLSTRNAIFPTRPKPQPVSCDGRTSPRNIDHQNN